MLEATDLTFLLIFLETMLCLNKIKFLNQLRPLPKLPKLSSVEHLHSF